MEETLNQVFGERAENTCDCGQPAIVIINGVPVCGECAYEYLCYEGDSTEEQAERNLADPAYRHDLMSFIGPDGLTYQGGSMNDKCEECSKEADYCINGTAICEECLQMKFQEAEEEHERP